MGIKAQDLTAPFVNLDQPYRKKHISQTRPRRATQQKASPIERDSTVTFGDSCWTPPARFLVNFSLWILPLAVSIIQIDTTDHTNWLHSQMPIRQTFSV
ncbi:hypothetical protein T4E_10031 [Trichinella pseudospiralis]|uniref:Uncharacterized protein n=1 Tax=Trichinella pseudospiralis TaxID=6337 RepID=A0A0V0XV27_TRIPS|nr:hypothetical protein T4E_10031 [Trichinella pseudospiralis]